MRGMDLDSYRPSPSRIMTQPTRFAPFALRARFGCTYYTRTHFRIYELRDLLLDDGTDNLATQATVYANTLEACRAQPRCKALTIWGVSDKYSWIPNTFPGFGRGLPFDANFQPKPAYNSLRDIFARP